MPTESGIILPSDPVPAGRAQRTETVTTAFTSGAGGVVHMPVGVIGDPTTAANLLVVDSSGRITTKATDTAGQAQYNFPAGFVRTTDEPRQVFLDPFDGTLDTVNLWTAPTVGNGATIAANSGGVLTLGTGTTASGWSKLFSQASFKLSIPAWLGYSFVMTLPDGAAPVANSYLYWGSGTLPGTPTTTTPVTDGVGFERTTAGKLCAVVYAAGVRTQIADLSASGTNTQPLDANGHRYIVYVRTDRVFWYIDSLATPVATSNFQAPNVQTLPITLLAVGGATPPASDVQIKCSGATVWDTGKNATQLSDGTYPWRKAAIDATGALKTKDEYQTQVDVADQSGANGVLTFTLGQAVSLVIVTSIGGVSRANVSGGTPTATSGIVCVDGGPTYIPVASAGTIKVYAPAGATVSCSGLVRS